MADHDAYLDGVVDRVEPHATGLSLSEALRYMHLTVVVSVEV